MAGGDGTFLGALVMLIFFFGGSTFLGWACTLSLALVVAVPATLAAEHWNHAASAMWTAGMVRLLRPPSVWILCNKFSNVTGYKCIFLEA
jgi:hypothetical protein